MNNNDWVVETHPRWYKDVPDMEVLILGSFPPHSSRWHYPFYYPNKQNRFWKILSHISGIQLHDYPKMDERFVEERYNIMLALKTGIQNLGYQIKRKGRSSSDTDIQIVRYHNILDIINKNKQIKHILLPGYAAPNSTYRAFIKYLKEKGILVDEVEKPIPGKTTFYIEIKNKSIPCTVVNSTSGRTSIPFHTLVKQFLVAYSG
ncbi:MAG: hypothetical protein RMJ53_07875 [Chitinophagales bacterium]|nr:hypothetical protein [Chitinophagales bacterium]